MVNEFDRVMDKVRHGTDWHDWSAEDLIRELCTEKDATKLLEQLETNRGRFRTQPMKGLLSYGWTSDGEEFRSVLLENLPLFVSLLPKGEKATKFMLLSEDPENLKKINQEQERARREQEEKARKILSKMKDFDPEDVPWEFRKYTR